VDAALSSLGEELTRLEMPLIEAFVARRAARTPRAV
jgi:hypothetical protein